MSTFATPQTLATWLHAHGVTTAQWGQGAAKSVTDLWQEILHGESMLSEEPPLRRVRVVEVAVRAGNQQLIEAAQTLVTGQIRRRNRPPSEKMHPTENPLAAAQRCLQEELGIATATILIEPTQPIGERHETSESSSYPGLLTHFTFYQVTAYVHGLPTSDFVTTNAAHDHGDPIVAHQWHWQAYP